MLYNFVQREKRLIGGNCFSRKEIISFLDPIIKQFLISKSTIFYHSLWCTAHQQIMLANIALIFNILVHITYIQLNINKVC